MNAEVYLQPPNDGLASDEDSDTVEGMDIQHLSADQLNAPGDFKIDFGSHVADSFRNEEEKRFVCAEKDLEIEEESGNISNSAGKQSENGKEKDESDSEVRDYYRRKAAIGANTAQNYIQVEERGYFKEKL